MQKEGEGIHFLLKISLLHFTLVEFDDFNSLLLHELRLLHVELLLSLSQVDKTASEATRVSKVKQPDVLHNLHI